MRSFSTYIILLILVLSMSSCFKKSDETVEKGSDVKNVVKKDIKNVAKSDNRAYSKVLPKEDLVPEVDRKFIKQDFITLKRLYISTLFSIKNKDENKDKLLSKYFELSSQFVEKYKGIDNKGNQIKELQNQLDSLKKAEMTDDEKVNIFKNMGKNFASFRKSNDRYIYIDDLADLNSLIEELISSKEADFKLVKQKYDDLSKKLENMSDLGFSYKMYGWDNTKEEEVIDKVGSMIKLLKNFKDSDFSNWEEVNKLKEVFDSVYSMFGIPSIDNIKLKKKIEDRSNYVATESDYINGGKLIKDIEKTKLSEEEIKGLQEMREKIKVMRDLSIKFYDINQQQVLDDLSSVYQSYTDGVKAIMVKYYVKDFMIYDIGTFSNKDLQSSYDLYLSKGKESLIQSTKSLFGYQDILFEDLSSQIDKTDNKDILVVYDAIRKGLNKNKSILSGFLEIIK